MVGKQDRSCHLAVSLGVHVHMSAAKRQSLGIQDGEHEDAEHTLILKLNLDPLVHVRPVQGLVLVFVLAGHFFARWDPPLKVLVAYLRDKPFSSGCISKDLYR